MTQRRGVDRVRPPGRRPPRGTPETPREMMHPRNTPPNDVPPNHPAKCALTPETNREMGGVDRVRPPGSRPPRGRKSAHPRINPRNLLTPETPREILYPRNSPRNALAPETPLDILSPPNPFLLRSEAVSGFLMVSRIPCSLESPIIRIIDGCWTSLLVREKDRH